LEEVYNSVLEMLKRLKNILIAGIIFSTIILYSDFLMAQTTKPIQEITRYLASSIPINNQNWNIYKNKKTGFVYFANSSGLGEYNGISVKMYAPPFGRSLRSVFVSDDGTIYTGSFEEFGLWKDSINGDLTYKSLTKNINVEKNDEIWKIYEVKGIIYFQSFTSVYTYDHVNIKKITAPFTMLFLFQTDDKFIAQVLGKGLFWFDGTDFKLIQNSEFLKRIEIHSVIKRSDHEYWICTANNGIYIFDGNQFKYFNSDISQYLTFQTCNAGLKISDSLFVFGTISNGIVFCDNNGKITKTLNYTNGLRNNTVLSLFKDETNGLWIGLDDGANYLNILSPSTIYSNLSGNLGTIYTAIRDGGKLFLGTNHGLFEEEISMEGEEFNFSNLKFIPYTQGQVWTLSKFDNQIICGHNDGTFLLDDQKFRKISDVTGGWAIREYNDLLIEGTYTGIVLFRKNKDGKWTFRNKIEGFSEPTRHIEVDYLGYIWASHPQKGIFQLELNEALDSVNKVQYFKTITNKPNNVDIYKVNNQIVFTNSDSIYTFNYDKKEIEPFVLLNSTVGDFKSATQIIPDIRNNYWFIKGNRIALFEITKDFKATKLLEIVQKSANLPERELRIIHLSDETILIPTREAFTTYNLSLISKDSDYSKLAINKLVFRGKSKPIELATGSHGTIKVPYNYNNLTAFFSDPLNFDREGIRYQYRLLEIDEMWHDISGDNFSFLHLPFGTFHLQVKPEASKTIVESVFIIQRPWYLTFGAFLLYFLIFAGLIFTGVRIFRIELKRQRKIIDFEINNTKLASELDFKSYELMLTMRNLFQKNENMLKLQEQITMIKQQSKYPVKIVSEMEKIINNGLDSQTKEWRNVMNSLKLSQEGFFNVLLKKHPNLTPNDLRLCSYLRMNFTTKEIAQLLNISSRAVEISRYRLRQKINLSHDVNLTEYLMKESEKQG
jgi:DNA-binding CsgD family transcriptional regulator